MFLRTGFLVALPLLIGCGGELRFESSDKAAAEVASTTTIAGGEVPAGEGSAAKSDRKIVCTAKIDLVVDDFAQTQQKITALVGEVGGYVATFREDRRYGDQLAGNWVVRLPAQEFDHFTAQLARLGVPTSREIDAQDVTEQYIDLASRLSNKQRLEERVVKLLDGKTGQIKDVIEVETQLGRIREEVESLEGKLRFLFDRIAMTTVTISAREDRNYTPPQAPTFAGKASDVFQKSLTMLQLLAEGLALMLVAVSPWLLLAAVVLGLPLTCLLRKRRQLQRVRPMKLN